MSYVLDVLNRWIKELEGVLESSWGNEEPYVSRGDDYFSNSNESLRLDIKWLSNRFVNISIVSVDDSQLDTSRVIVREWRSRNLIAIENLKRSVTRKHEFWAQVDLHGRRAFRLEFLS
ncbi:MAG: hypothetical protein A3A51_04725 [Candidatus Levybacteria bacterium RIFCSPLOWO2_01_FULL_39_10]|nr:MAG: hypothetical protein A3A51_04725 [Candidatus Levybacteria bacterium RIFCSPLOWO2_01_FULL_39_10]